MLKKRLKRCARCKCQRETLRSNFITGLQFPFLFFTCRRHLERRAGWIRIASRTQSAAHAKLRWATRITGASLAKPLGMSRRASDATFQTVLFCPRCWQGWPTSGRAWDGSRRPLLPLSFCLPPPHALYFSGVSIFAYSEQTNKINKWINEWG